MPDAFTDALPLIIAGLTIAFAVAGLRWSGRRVRELLEVLRSIYRVIDLEANPNDGKSMKDGVIGIRQAIESHNEWSRTSLAAQDEKLEEILERLS